MKKLWLLVSFALVLVLGACGGDGEGGEDESEQPADEGVTTEEGGDEGDGADSSDTALAEQTYEQNNCMGCHGQDLSGMWAISSQKMKSVLKSKKAAVECQPAW